MKDRESGAGLPPEVLLELLEAARAAVPMEERYRHAATLAWSMTRLRQECTRLGFKNASWGAYLGQLVEASKVDPQPVLEWFGLGSVSDRAPVSALCRFAQELGIAFDELVAYVYRSVAAERNMPVPISARGAAMDDREYAERCAVIIEELPWDTETHAQLIGIKGEIRGEYGHNRPRSGK